MYHWKFIPKIMRKTEWAPMRFRFRLKNCLRFLLCVSLQGKPSPRFSSPLGGHRLCQGMDAQCPFLKIDFLIFQTLGGCIKDVIRKIISSSPWHFLMTPALLHPCRRGVSAFPLMRSSKKQAQCKPTWENHHMIQQHMNVPLVVMEVVMQATGHGKGTTHVQAHSVKSCGRPMPLNCRPAIFPLKSHTQNAERLCRKNPWQQHIQSLLILFEKNKFTYFSFLTF